jgi:hypothetical protein
VAGVLDCLELQTVSVLPGAFEDVAVGQLHLSLPVELAVAEVAHVDAAVALAPLEPPRPVDHVVVKVPCQDARLRVQRAPPLLLAVGKLSRVAHLAVGAVVVAEAVHAAAVELAAVGLAGGCRLVGALPLQPAVELELLLLLLLRPARLEALLHARLEEPHVLAAVPVLLHPEPVRLGRPPPPPVAVRLLPPDVVPHLALALDHAPPHLPPIRCAVWQDKITVPVVRLAPGEIALVVASVGEDAETSAFGQTVHPLSAIVRLVVGD